MSGQKEMLQAGVEPGRWDVFDEEQWERELEERIDRMTSDPDERVPAMKKRDYILVGLFIFLGIVLLIAGAFL